MKANPRLDVAEPELRAALDEILQSALRPLTLGLALLYTVLAPIKPFALGGSPALVASGTVALLTGLEVVMAASFFALAYLLHNRPVPPRSAHPIAAAVAGALILDSTLHLALLPKPLETVSFILLALGIAFFILRPAWYVGLLTAIVAGFGAGVSLSPSTHIPSPSSPFVDLGLYLAEAGVLSMVVFTVRLRTYRRLVTLRIRDERMRLELEATNAELEAFSYSISHDLRAPLRSIDGFSLAVLEDFGELLPDSGRHYLERVRANTQRMGELIDDQLRLSRVARAEMRMEDVDVLALARRVAAERAETEPDRDVDVVIGSAPPARGDRRLIRLMLENLLDNAWKYTKDVPLARIEVGTAEEDGQTAYFVRDNGVGFDDAYVDKLFRPFSRLTSSEDFPGTGIGLATVQRIVRRHGGRVWASGREGEGATFYFTL